MSGKPVLVLELGEQEWSVRLRHIAQWLRGARLLQQTLIQVLGRAAAHIHEPHAHRYLLDVREQAVQHERTLDTLAGQFGLEHVGGHTATAAALLGAVKSVAAQATGRIAGAGDPGWRLLREAIRASQDAIAGYAVIEQLGLAMGITEVVDTVLPVARAKQQSHVLLQEFLLEFACDAVLLARSPAGK